MATLIEDSMTYSSSDRPNSLVGSETHRFVSRKMPCSSPSRIALQQVALERPVREWQVWCIPLPEKKLDCTALLEVVFCHRPDHLPCLK